MPFLKEADMVKKELKKQDLIKKWKELECKSRKPIGVKTVCIEMGIKTYHVTQLLQGQSLTEFKLQNGIKTCPQEIPYTQEHLLSKYDSVVSKLRKIPSWNQVKFEIGIPESTFKKKLGPTQLEIVKTYHTWLKKNKPNSRNIKIIEKWRKRDYKPDIPPVNTAKSSMRKSHVSAKTGGRTYGRPLGFENLVYEPANEQGVVVLFAMMSKHLQYNIEGIWQDSFPDCEAMRVESGGSLRRVKIEFEYKSKEFVTHGHNPNECDVIVCWKDNWKDCPQNIEVLELSKEVEKIKSTKK